MKFWTLLAVLAIACLLPIFAKKSDKDKATAGSICKKELGQCMVKESTDQCLSPLAKLDCPDGKRCCKTIPKDYDAAGLPLKKRDCVQDSNCTKVGGKCIYYKGVDCEGKTLYKLCKSKRCTCCHPCIDPKITELGSALKSHNTVKRDDHSYCTRKGYQKAYKDSCYFTSTTRENWWDAQKKCIKKGGNLVKIDDDDEFIFLQQDRSTEDSWIGLSDKATEGTYIWVAKEVSAKSSWWANGEPNNNKRNEDCIHFNRLTLPKLNDLPCNYIKKYICEMPTNN